MAGLPIVQVLLDDVNNGGTWPHDITTKARLSEGYSITSRGRSDENSGPQAVTMTLTLDNTNGDFTLGSTIGGYGAINLDRGIRVKVTANGVTTTRFTGFVLAWPVEWPGGSDKFALVTVTAVDAMARWARRTLRSVIEEEVMLDSPAVYYTLGEPEGAVSAADSSGNQAPTLERRGAVLGVVGTPVTFGTATGPGTDGLTGGTFPNATLGLRATPIAAVTYLSCWFLATAVSGGGATLAMWMDKDSDFRLQLGFDGSGFLFGVWSNADLSVYVEVTYAVNVADSLGHSLELVLEPGAPGTLRLFLQGIEVDTATGTAPAPTGTGALIVGENLIGSMAHVSAGSTLSAAAATRFFQYTAAMFSGFGGERSDQHINRFAIYEGTALGSALDVGVSQIPFIDITGKTVADMIQQVANAEQGVAYIDGEGRTAMHNRHRATLKVAADLVLAVGSDILSPSTAVQADMAEVVNIGSGTRAGVDTASTLTVINKPSRDLHGEYPGGGDYLVQTDQEVLDRLNWLVTTHADPKARMPDLVLDLLSADAAVQAAVMALGIDSRVQITPLPSQSPTGSLADLKVLGYSESLSRDGWQWMANAVSWPAYAQAWILGDATHGQLDNSTRLAV